MLMLMVSCLASTRAPALRLPLPSLHHPPRPRQKKKHERDGRDSFFSALPSLPEEDSDAAGAPPAAAVGGGPRALRLAQHSLIIPMA